MQTESLTKGQGSKYPRYRGSLYRFLYDSSAVNTHEGSFSLGTNEFGWSLASAVTFEAIGMFLYQFVWIAINAGAHTTPFYLAILLGVQSFMFIVVFGGISGAHFNPLITVATMACGMTSIVRGVLYITVQIIAALISAKMVLDAIGDNYTVAPFVGTCGNINDKFSGGFSILLNMVQMTLYLLFIFRIALDKRTSSLFGPQHTTVITSLGFAFLMYTSVGFNAFGIFIIPNPAICISGYYAYDNSNIGSDTTDASFGATASVIGAIFASVINAIMHRYGKPHYNDNESEEVERNQGRLDQLKSILVDR